MYERTSDPFNYPSNYYSATLIADYHEPELTVNHVTCQWSDINDALSVTLMEDPSLSWISMTAYSGYQKLTIVPTASEDGFDSNILIKSYDATTLLREDTLHL